MALTQAECDKFASFLFRRTPDFDKELGRDRHPFSYLYTSMYPQKTWESFTGYEHTFDRVHVTRPNDNGEWGDAMDATDCTQAICDPERHFVGWGSTRDTYKKYRRIYQTPVFCIDQLRHVEQGIAQLAAVVAGLKKLPDLIVDSFMRRHTMSTAGKLFICGNANAELDIVTSHSATGAWFNPNGDLDLGAVGNLPTSMLTVDYLDNHIEDLLYNGYFDGEFLPEGKFGITCDIQTWRNMANQNAALTGMYQAADFIKGGKYYAYGVMGGVGNWLQKLDKEPIRFQHIGSGVLRQVFPFENSAATVGKKPVFSHEYKTAKYQAYHVFNRASREMYVGDITSVNPEMKFNVSRNMLGKWSWKSPDYFRSKNPETGDVCEYQNDLGNKGYFVGDFELGVKTINTDIEMWIIAKRGPQDVGDDTAIPHDYGDWVAGTSYQDLKPYNDFCPIDD